MRYGILGPLEVLDGDRRVDLGGPKQRALLAVLLIEAGRVVSLDRLIDLLWGDAAPARATGSLQVYVSHLRRALEPDRRPGASSQVLLTQPPGYLLRVNGDELDAARFESLATEGRRLLGEGRHAPARQVLQEALALWRGDALAEFAYEEFARPSVTRWEELRQGTIEDRIEADLALGVDASALAELRDLLVRFPLRERLWGLLMVALYRSGRQGDALRAFAQARSVLREQMGVDPGRELERLEAAVLAHAPTLEWRRPVADAASEVISRPAPEDTTRALVGRSDELAALTSALESTRQGRGQVVLISGEPGIGKTRLVEDLVSQASAGAVGVACGRADEGDGAPPFWPWVQVIGALVAEGSATIREALAPVAGELAQMVPQVKDLFSEATPPQGLDPAEARFRLYEAVSTTLNRLATSGPLVVVLEDLHWADAPSLQLVAHLAPRLEAIPLLLVVTYRDVDPRPRSCLTETLGVLARLPDPVRIPLSGLDQPEVAQFMAQAAGEEPSPDVVASVWERTGGNPFFVAELARLLVAEGDPALVPPGVRDVIRRRLVRLPEATNRLLTLGAVAGQDFDLRVVSAAAGVDDEVAAERLDSAVACNVVVEDRVSVGRFRFCHALVQETIYAETAGLGRARLHGMIGQALEQQPGAAHLQLAELASHFFQAAPILGPERGISYCLEAAEVAQAALAFERAADLLGRALRLVEDIPVGRERLERESLVQNRLALFLTATRGLSAVETADAWTRSRYLHTELGEARELLIPLFGLFIVHCTRGDHPTAATIGCQLLEMGEAVDDPALTLAGHQIVGMTSLECGLLVEARDHLEQSMVLIATFEEDALARIFPMHPGGFIVELAVVCHLMGDEDRCRTLRAEANALRDRIAQPLHVGPGLILDLQLQVSRGAFDALPEDAADASQRCQEWGLMDMAAVADFWATLAHQRCDGRDRTAQLTEALMIVDKSGFRIWRTQHLAFLAESYHQVGKTDQALGYVDEGLDEAGLNNERFWEPELHRLRGEFLVASDATRRAEAVQSVERAIAVARSQASVTLERRALATLTKMNGASVTAESSPEPPG